MSEHNGNSAPAPDPGSPGRVRRQCPNPECGHSASVALEDLKVFALRCPRCQTKFKSHADSTNSADLQQTKDWVWWSNPPVPDNPPAAAVIPSCPPDRPTRIGRFEILQFCGEGAFCKVYRAYDPQLRREVAVKVPQAGKLTTLSRQERFLGDARASARLSHPHIVPVYDVGHDGETLFIATAFIKGQTLKAATEVNKLDRKHAVRIVLDLAEALDYAHSQGIIHRDIKPANVMLDTSGTAHLIDFGLAGRQEPNTLEAAEEKGAGCAGEGDLYRTRVGAILGTPAYMSPEQTRGHSSEVGPATDQYSLGVTLYELLVGDPPFTRMPLPSLYYHIQDVRPTTPRSLVPDIALDLEAICLKAIAKKPEDRYPNCQQLADDLGRYLEGEPVKARPLGQLERLARWSRREPALALASGLALAAILCVAILGVAFGLYEQQSRKKIAEALDAKEGALDKANEAEDEAKRQAEEAKRQEDKAKREAKEADRQRLRELGRQAQLTFDRGTDAARQGEIGMAMSKWVEALRLAETANDPDMQRVIRYNLAAWRYHVHGLASCFDPCLDQPIVAADFDAKTEEVFLVTRTNQGGSQITRYDQGGKPLKHKTLSDRITTLAYLSSQRLLVLGSERGQVLVLDSSLDSPNILACWKMPHSEASIHSIACDPEGKLLLVGCNRGLAYLWQTRDMKPLEQVKVLRLQHLGVDKLFGVAISRKGEYLLTGGGKGVRGFEGEATLWDRAGNSLGVLPHLHTVRGCAFGAGENQFATASGSLFAGEAQVWERDARGVHPLGAPLPHGNEVYGLVFSPEGERLLTWGQDRAARLWNLASGQQIGQPLRQPREVTHAAFVGIRSDIMTVSEDQVVRRWEPAPGFKPEFARPLRQRAQALASPAYGAAVGRPGRRFIMVGSENREGLALLYDNQKLLATMKAGEFPIRAVACSPNCDLILTGEGVETDGQSGLGSATLWDNRGLAQHTFPHPKTVRGVALSPNGDCFATACDDGTVRVWRMEALGEAPRRINATGKDFELNDREQDDAKFRITSVAFSRDGKYLLTGSRTGFACIFNVASGERLQKIPHDDVVLAVAFAPDERTLVTGYAGGARVWRWNPKEPKSEVQKLGAPFEHLAGIFSVEISPNGRMVLTGGTDGTARLWDFATRKPLGPPWPLGGVVFTTTFGADRIDSGADESDLLVMTTHTSQKLRGTTCLWKLARPVTEKQEHLNHWVQTLNGLKWEMGGVAQLSLEEWQEQKRQMGSPPDVENGVSTKRREPAVDFGGPVASRPSYVAVPEKRAALPPQQPFSLDELDLLLEQPGARALAVVNLRQVLASPLGKQHLRPLAEVLLENPLVKDLKALENLGFSILDNVDQLALLVTRRQGSNDLLGIGILRGNFSPLLKAAPAFAKEKLRSDGRRIFSLRIEGKESFFYFPDEKTLIVASTESLLEAWTPGLKPNLEKGKDLKTKLHALEGWAGVRLVVSVPQEEMRMWVERYPEVLTFVKDWVGLGVSLTIEENIHCHAVVDMTDQKSAEPLLDFFQRLKSEGGGLDSLKRIVRLLQFKHEGTKVTVDFDVPASVFPP